MTEKLDDLQHADFTNQTLKKKLVSSKFELEEEEKCHEKTIKEANERIDKKQGIIVKQRAKIKNLRHDKEVYFDAVTKKDKKFAKLLALYTKLYGDEKVSRDQVGKLYRFESQHADMVEAIN